MLKLVENPATPILSVRQVSESPPRDFSLSHLPSDNRDMGRPEPALLKHVFEAISRLATEVRFDKSDPREFLMVATYCTALEVTENCLVLMDRPARTGVPVLVRAAIEALVDVLNLAAKPTYHLRLQRNYLEDIHSLSRTAKLGKNQYLVGLAEPGELTQRLRTVGKEIERVKNSGGTRIGPEDKFKIAGLEDFHQTVWKELAIAVMFIRASNIESLLMPAGSPDSCVLNYHFEGYRERISVSGQARERVVETIERSE